MSRGKVLVAMSGGVDSSVAAYLLKQQGYEVTGATMQIWQDEPVSEAEQDRCDRGCCSLAAVDDARRVASLIDIPYYVLNFKAAFAQQVIEPFVEAYHHAITPNPCILCNRFVKFEGFLQRARALGFDYIATGHYGRILNQGGQYFLARSTTLAKDQSYALYSLTQDQLAHLLLPLGELEKEQVREIAQQIGLPVADKPDSQEICFVPDGDYAQFIRSHPPVHQPPYPADQPGAFVLEDGTVLGQHRGLIHYTIGQRKGLGIAYRHPLFVIELRPQTNEVVLGPHERLMRTGLLATDLVGAVPEWFNEPIRVEAKVRYRAQAEPAVVYPLSEGRWGVVFDSPQRALTPGQAVVFYKEALVLGGATILDAQPVEQILDEWRSSACQPNAYPPKKSSDS